MYQKVQQHIFLGVIFDNCWLFIYTRITLVYQASGEPNMINCYLEHFYKRRGERPLVRKKILLFEFYLLPLLTFLHTSRFVRYDLEYAFLIHKCLTLYANNYMQAQKWLQCTLTLNTLMYNFAMTGFFYVVRLDAPLWAKLHFS